MTNAIDLGKVGNISNAMLNSMSTNSTAITSMSVGTTTINSSTIAVGGTTINASGVSGISNIFVGNTTVNATVNSTAFTIANSTANAVVNTTGLAVGNTTVNATVNSTAFTIANSTVTYSYISPTAAQKANTTFFLNANGSWSLAATAAPTFITLTDGATISWNTANSIYARVTLGGNRTIAAPTNLTPGPLALIITQDATGSRTVTWNSVFRWAANVAPDLSTAANSTDFISMITDGTYVYGSYLRGV
jgi:hypothetical protein